MKREDFLLGGPFIGVSGVGSLAVDTTAQQMMSQFLSHDSGIPAVTSAADHVLFRAVSMAVSAKDSLAAELRLRCCVEMVKYQNYYRYQKNHHLLASCAPDYADSCIDCAFIDEGSSVWTMAALASVVRRPITSVYPNVNGLSDLAVEALNTTFKPREGEVSSQVVRILWSSEGVPITVGNWKPNHFVPLFDQQKAEPSPSKSHRRHRAADLDLGPDLDHDMENFEDAFEDDSESESPREEPETEPVVMEVAEGGFPIEFGKFMDVFEAYEKITTATVVNSDIPRGLKENVWFLIDNSHNVTHPERRNTFFDDCGVWDSKHGSVAKGHLLLDDSGILCTLKIHGGVFKRLSKIKGKQVWVAIDPQPDPDRVVVCHRYYAFLKRSPQFKRRIIWFTMPPTEERGRDVALVEYLGKFPGFKTQRHGNSKRGKGGTRNYIRTDPKLLEEISKQIKMGTNLTPMKIFKEIKKKLGSSCTLRDPRQIRNLKYSILKRARKEQQAHLNKLRLGAEFSIVPSDAAEINLTDVGDPSMGAEFTRAAYPTPIKVIIHQGQGDMETELDTAEVNEMTHAKIMQMEEGQQAISIMDTDTNGIPDPSTQTIIMVKDLNAAIAGNEVIVTEAL